MAHLPQNLPVQDVFELLSEGYRIRYPTGFQDWSVVRDQARRPRMFTVGNFVGVQNMTFNLNVFQHAGINHPVTLEEVMAEARPFIMKLHNPKRISLLIPTPTGWKESEAIFAMTPRMWDHLDGRLHVMKEFQPNAFHVHVAINN